MRRTFIITAIVYLFSAAVIFPFVRWYADNPDTFQYLAIAGKYISGDWSHALNGYWSPLISWLLSIPLLIFNDDLLVFKILQLLIGIFTLYQWTKLVEKMQIRNSLKYILAFISIPFFIDYALLNLTPDLLFMALLFMLMNILISGDIFSDRKNALKTGIAGGLLFLAKSFGLPFFIVIILILTGIKIKQQGSKQFNWRNFSILFGIFLMICLFRIIPLSIHYNQFTISKAAEFNSSRDVAPLPGRSDELPVLGSGLFMPEKNSLSAWETPGDYVSNESIGIFNSPSGYFKIIKRNLLTIYYFDFSRQEGIVFLALLLLFIVMNGFKKLTKEKWIAIPLLFILLIYGGYSLILVHSRYTWINNLLMLLLSAYFIQSVFNKKQMKVSAIILLTGIFLLSVKRPVKEILFTTDMNSTPAMLFNALRHPFETMRSSYHPDTELQRSIEDIHNKKIISGNIASLKIKEKDRDAYTNALRISYKENCRYFGQLPDDISYSDQLAELKKMDIDYLILFKNAEWGNDKPIYENSDSGIKIYSLK